MEYILSGKQKSFSLFLKGNGFIRVLWNSFEFKDVSYARNSIGVNRSGYSGYDGLEKAIEKSEKSEKLKSF
jgi:hypothetical protein